MPRRRYVLARLVTRLQLRSTQMFDNPNHVRLPAKFTAPLIYQLDSALGSRPVGLITRKPYDASAATKWVIRDLTLDFENGLVIRAGKPITVRHKLFELLAFFARNQNRVVSKDELVLAVWRGAAITDDALTQTVSQARRCIQDRKIIRTISKRGFLFASDTPLELGRNAREEPLVRPIVSPEKLFDPNAVHLLRKSNEQEGARANAPIDNFGQKSRNALAGPVQGDATGKEFANTSWGLSKIVPPLLAEAAENTRLFRRLDAALEKPVVWLQGPPGAGKTTLIAKYAAARGRRPIWLRFDAEDGDVATLFFFLGLAEAYARPASGQRRTSRVRTRLSKGNRRLQPQFLSAPFYRFRGPSSRH